MLGVFAVPSVILTIYLKFEKCLGHGNKLHILKAKWRGKPIVLKTFKPLGTLSLGMLSFQFSKPLNHNFKITRQEFIETVSLISFVINTMMKP